MGTTSLLEAVLASLELTAKPKVTSEKLGFYITYLKAFTAPRSTSLPGREKESMHRKKLNILRKIMSESSKGQPLPWEQGAKCSDAASRTETHPKLCKQGRPRDSSQIQSRVPVVREAHGDEADPGSSWKSIH